MPVESRPFPPPPSKLFGALFEQVQAERLFADSKTFPDLLPLQEPGFILEQYRRARRLDREQLLKFVEKYFSQPAEVGVFDRRPGRELTGRIQDLWSALIRRSTPEPPHSSLIQTSHAYVVPGGRFAEAYYWDSYFSVLGLFVDGRVADAQDIVSGFAALIDRFGFIPNGTRTYYLSRSQPPLFYLMLERAGLPEDEAVALELLVREHAFWMSGAEALDRGQAARRVVKLPDGSVLNRYWDDGAGPRDEAYAEDCTLATMSGRPAEDLYRDLRAAAESGWDFSSRWLEDPSDLASIRTTAILPIDLNTFLWGLETAVHERSLALAKTEQARAFAELADRRAQAMRKWLWNAEADIFCDYDWKRGARRTEPTAALLAPLFVGFARASEAASVAAVVRTRLLRPGGVVTSGIDTGQQWDAPNGWAPLQWIAVEGLARYGHIELAETIANRWLTLVEDMFEKTGLLFEKYDVQSLTAGGGGEYPNQVGFGWTNGVTRALMQWRAREHSTTRPSL